MPDTTFVASASASSGMGAYTVTVPKPAGTLEGHLMYAHIGFVTTSSAVADDAHPSGWTVIPGGGEGKRIWYKVADATDETVTTDYTWDYTTASTAYGSAPVLGIICTYADFGTRGLDSCVNARFGAASIGIPGYANISYITQNFAALDHSPPTVMDFRYPHIIGAMDEQRSSLTPPTHACDHANLRETVSEAGMWAAIGANAAWTLTAFDVLDSAALRQVEYMPSVSIASDSSTSSGNSSVGCYRNQDNDEVEELPPAPVPVVGSARIELPQTRMHLKVLPNKLTQASLHELT
jgi:hypothetical protein